MADGAWLLQHLTLPQRGDLIALTRATYAAIDMLNSKDEFGKACCWLARDAEPETVLEQLVHQIAMHDLSHPTRACDLTDVVGFEWWLQLRPPNAGMPFHHDTDWNDHQSGATENLSFASCSTVTSLTGFGGPLVVLAPHDASREAQAVRHTDEYERLLNSTLRAGHAAHISLPAFGKHVRFRGGLYHGVLQQPVIDSRGDRIALVVAHWTRPMERVRRFPREALQQMLAKQGLARTADEWRTLSTMDPSPFSPTETCAEEEAIAWRHDPEGGRTRITSEDALTRSRLELSLPANLEAGSSVVVGDAGLAPVPVVGYR